MDGEKVNEKRCKMHMYLTITSSYPPSLMCKLHWFFILLSLKSSISEGTSESNIAYISRKFILVDMILYDSV